MSPDLRLRILIPNLTWDRAEQIARATRREGAIPIETGPRRVLIREQLPSLISWSVHDFLGESAHWSNGTWGMKASGLPFLSRTLEILFEQIPEAFAVEMMWIGDEATEDRAVSREELLDIARQGRFGTHTRYLVTSRASLL